MTIMKILMELLYKLYIKLYSPTGVPGVIFANEFYILHIAIHVYLATFIILPVLFSIYFGFFYSQTQIPADPIAISEILNNVTSDLNTELEIIEPKTSPKLRNEIRYSESFLKTAGICLFAVITLTFVFII